MKTPPASSRHLSAFAIDVGYALEQTGRFSRVTVKKTGDPECSLEVKCSLADPLSHPTEIGAFLESAWHEVEYCGGENSCKITYSQETVELWFSTIAGVRVTGCVRVVGFKQCVNEA